MRRNAWYPGGLVLVAAMAAVAACSDDPPLRTDGGAGKGGAGGSSAGNGGGGATGGGAAGTGGTGGTSDVGGAGGTGGSAAGGTTGSGGAAGSGGSATGGTAAGGTAGGTGGTVGTAGTGGGAAGTGGGGTGGGGTSGGGTGGGSGTGGGGTGGGGGSGGGGTGGMAGTGAGGTGGAAGTGGGAGTGGAGGTSGTAGSAAALAPPAISGGAVLNSDFVSTSVSLLSTQGALVRGDCVHSTTTGTGAKTISGDVVLPSQPQRGGQVVLIDRGNTALTFVNPATCMFDRQLSVKGGFNLANPHDVVIVSASKAYVTRYGKNPAATSAMAEGDDVLIIDPRDGTITGRIALSSYASAQYPASPDRAIIAAGKVVVSLNRWSAATFAYDRGSVVIIDPATDMVTQQVVLGDLKNCEGLDYVEATKSVLVACGGSFGSPEQALESGVAVVDMRTTPAALSRVISAVAFQTPPVTFLWVMSLPSATSPLRAFTSTLGSFSPSAPDRLYYFDFITGGTMSFGTASPFDMGRPAGASGRLLVPDANAAMPRIHVYDVSGTAPTEGQAFVSDSANGLPPREIAWY